MGLVCFARVLSVSFVLAAVLLPFAARAETPRGESSSAAPKPLEIIRVTPDGQDIPSGRQIVIQFNRPVVPVGKMERRSDEIPVVISPALSCEWRWINTAALACQLPDKAPLQVATRYTLDVKPGLKAEDGATLAAPYHHEFITERPDIRDKDFYKWTSPSLPVVRLAFNQPVDKESVARHVFLAVGPNGEKRVSVTVRPDPSDRTLPQFIPVPGENYALFFKKSPPQKSDDDLQRKSGHEARRVWLVEPVRELPLDAHVVLKSEAGLRSAFGSEPGVTMSDVVQFETYPEFSFLGVKCSSNDKKELFIPAGQNPSGKCNPMETVQLSFSAPVDRRKVSKMLTFSPAIGSWKSPWESDVVDEEEAAPPSDESGGDVGYQFRQPHSQGRTYEIWLPGGLKAAQDYAITSRSQDMSLFARAWYRVKSWFTPLAPIDVQDIFGRNLQQPVSSHFATDHRPPNFVLDYTDAVLEKGVESEIPFYVNNLENFSFNYRRVMPQNGTNGGNVTGQVFSKQVPNAKDVQFAVPLGVRDMLNGGTGAVFGSLQTTPNVGKYTPRLFAQVTPYQVHLKLGHFNTIVWVTDMGTGVPVPGAKISLYQDAFSTLHMATTDTASALTDESGIAVLPGTDTIDPDLTLTRKWGDDDVRYFVRVEKGGDMALLPVAQSFMIDPYRASGSETVYPSNLERYGHIQTWGTTAQGIYRAGDTVQYKIYVRNQDNSGFIPAPEAGYRLKVIDPTAKVVHDIRHIKLSPYGGISGEFAVPKDGAVGWYQFKLIAEFSKKSGQEDEAGDNADAPSESGAESGPDGRANDEGADNNSSQKSWIPMRVLISDFTPSPFKVSNQLNGDLFHSGETVDVSTHAELYSGGAYTDAAVRVTAILDSAPFLSKHPLAKNFQFDSYEMETSSQQVFQKIGTVNAKGEFALSFPTGTPKVVYGKLMVESAVADDRGKFVSGQSVADYVGVDRLVGLHPVSWLYTAGKPAIFQYLVVDSRGTPATGTPVDITVEHEVQKAARVKGAGNAYVTEYHDEWESAGSCHGVSEAAPIDCTFTPTKAGLYRVTAKIKDTKGNPHSTVASTYVTGSDFVLWDNGSDSSLTLVPERTDYKVGDTARYLVKNPYPGAKALITVERYGVLDHFVQTFNDSTPVVEFKIKPDYLPGFYLSVVIVSPRVAKPLGEGQVDLGKPTYRMGYLTVPVKDPYKEMVVTAKADKEIYKPRDKVTVRFHAEPRVTNKKEPVEITVAVLDESVFDLIAGGKGYFDPYEGFYKLESLDLRNYSLLTRLVGRQRFEKKGANPGGDGGADLSMRSLFKFVSYWNAELKTDQDGNATVSFDAPDNLTGWRILALAATPSDRFGLGEAHFKVNRPTEIRPVMPNQVMEEDRFDAGFSVMNRTNSSRTVTVHIQASGDLDATQTPAELTKTVTLEPYKRATVLMPVQTQAKPLSQAQVPSRSQDPSQQNEKEWGVHFTATAGDDLDRDGVEHVVPVHKPRNLEVAANYGTTTQDRIEEPVRFPKEMLPNVGDVSVVASPTVIGNVTGAFNYMRDYPYTCWEQKLSKGVMAAHYKNLKAYLPPSFAWDGGDALPQQTLNQAASFQAPNGGMAYFVAQDQYVDPYLSAYTAIAFNWLRKSGYAVPEPVENKLQAYLINLLKNDAVPDFYSEGMTSTVRAVALAALAERGKVDLSDLERYQPHVNKMSLFGKSYFLQAALAVKGGEKYAPDVAKTILAASNETGGKFVFNETWDDSYTRILASPSRENCAVLDAFTAYGEREGGRTLVGDVPFKLVRAITQSRKNRDHWDNTQENMFCMNALIDFARVYETDKPDMTVVAAMDGQRFGQTTFKDVRDPAVVFYRAVAEGDVGRQSVVSLERRGTGRLYYSTRLAYALPLDAGKAANAGIEIHREYSVKRDGAWKLLDVPAQVQRGELVRVDLYVSVPAARNFVVVNDPVPGGLEPINRDLATSSDVDARQGDFNAAGGSFWFKFSDWIDFGVDRWHFYHQEIRHDSVRFYSDYLPAGNYHLSYAAQVIATGAFGVSPAVAEEMYDPDVYGKTEPARLSAREQEAKQ